MNSHGRRFQASIELAELHGLLNPNGIVTIDGRDHTVREMILQQKTAEGKIMILSVTRKWKSNAWQASYIKQERASASDFTSCPAAYLGYPLDDNECVSLYKHFTPESVDEAIAA